MISLHSTFIQNTTEENIAYYWQDIADNLPIIAAQFLSLRSLNFFIFLFKSGSISHISDVACKEQKIANWKTMHN